MHQPDGERLVEVDRDASERRKARIEITRDGELFAHSDHAAQFLINTMCMVIRAIPMMSLGWGGWSMSRPEF